MFLVVELIGIQGKDSPANVGDGMDPTCVKDPGGGTHLQYFCWERSPMDYGGSYSHCLKKSAETPKAEQAHMPQN